MRRDVDPQWIRGPADELAVRQGCYFDEEAGLFVCDFLETFCRLSEGRWAGQPMRLIPWQRDATMRAYGWMRADGCRRFQTVYVEVGKKNGKSPWVSGLTCYHLIADGEGGPKVFLNACDREQAKIVFDAAALMVDQSPDLASRLQVMRGNANRIVTSAHDGYAVACSATVDAKDGRNASLVVFDELHRQPDRKLYNVYIGSGASRRQPLWLDITTAGEDDTGVWHDRRVYSERVNAGEVPDTSHLGIVHRAKPDDDFDDPAVWRKANPSLGHTITEEQFGRELFRAKQNPIDWHDFLRKRFNVIARSAAKYFDVDRWDACAAAGGLGVEHLAGLDTFLGLDLSSTDDLTALVALGRYGRKLRLVTRFWCPEDNLLALERRTRRPYRHWAEKGYLKTTPGNAIDYGFIRQEVKDIAARARLKKGLIDSWNAQQLCNDLIEDDGLPFEFIRQGYQSLNAPTKEFKRLIDAGLVEHDGNPVMRWCVGNAVAVEDDQKNVKLSKQKSREKIDGAAAAVNAVGAATAAGAAGRRSVYDDRDLILL